MPPVPVSRKFEIVTAALALAEERDGVSLSDAAKLIGVDVRQLRELLTPVLYLEFRDGDGELLTRASEFFLDEDTGQLEVDPGGSNWLRDLAADEPSGEALLRLYVAATVYQAASHTVSATLDSALRKLRQAIAMEMVLPATRPAEVDLAETARTQHRTLRFRYLRWKADAATEREVQPLDVYCNWGKWYVVGPETTDSAIEDGQAVAKHWVISRMQDVALGATTFEPKLPPERPDWFDLGYRVLAVTVRVPERRLAALPRPHTVLSRSQDGDGFVVAEIEVAGDRQLDHLLVSLGPTGEVLEPTEYRERRRREAARLLALHGRPNSDEPAAC